MDWLKKLKPGDTLWLHVEDRRLANYGGLATVVKMGRKFAYVKHGGFQSVQVEIATGRRTGWPKAQAWPTEEECKAHHALRLAWVDLMRLMGNARPLPPAGVTAADIKAATRLLGLAK